MAEIELKKRVVYAGDVHIALLKAGWSIRDACDFVNGLPKADVAPVVHCKDCAQDGLSTCPICYIEGRTMVFVNHDPMFFCGSGVRKDGADNG